MPVNDTHVNKAILSNKTLQLGIFLRRFISAAWPKYCKNNIDRYMILNKH